MLEQASRPDELGIRTSMGYLVSVTTASFWDDSHGLDCHDKNDDNDENFAEPTMARSGRCGGIT